MTLPTKAIIFLALLTIASCCVYAQDEGDDDPKGNVNLGMPISAPLNPTGRYVNLGIGTTVGAGYNFNRRHAIVGEFMWNDLAITNGALAPIRTAFQNPGIGGSGNLLAFTGNYRFELRGAVRGLYLIGGGVITTATPICLRRLQQAQALPVRQRGFGSGWRVNPEA